jgi:hypothetical protein
VDLHTERTRTLQTAVGGDDQRRPGLQVRRVDALGRAAREDDGDVYQA